MMTLTATLNDIAKALKVHPRSVLRAISGKPNPYWYDTYNPDIDLAEIALAYNVEIDRLVSVMNGYDELMTMKEAMAHISFIQNKKLSRIHFMFRGYPALIKGPSKMYNKTKRYSKRDIVNHHADNIA